MSKRVKVGNTGSRRDTDVSGRAFEEYLEAIRRRDQAAERAATLERIADLARRQGWRIEERMNEVEADGSP